MMVLTRIASTVIVFLCWAFSAPAFAISKPYDAIAGVVLKSGVPCFYSIVPLDAEPPAYMKGGVDMSLFSESKNAPGYLWEAWFKVWKAPLPTSATSCVLYGIKSPGPNTRPAKAIPRDNPVSFSLLGEWGRQNVRFCIRKDEKGRDYLSTVVRQDGVASCTDVPLKNERP
jgi:hypothetical protein